MCSIRCPVVTILPDLLRHGLDLVLCGTAPSITSAKARAYYAHPQNKFWRILHDTGLTGVRIAPADYASLWQWNVGLTDIAKFAFGSDKDLRRTDFDPAALRAKIEKFRPRHLAFTSKKSAEVFFATNVVYGPQREPLDETEVWVLPSTSPAANWCWDPAPWHALAKAVGRT